MGNARRLRWALLLLCVFPGLNNAVEWSASEKALITSLGPWPAPWFGDPTNRFSEDQTAVSLGQSLFFDRRLSKNEALACADCHRPDTYFSDGISLNRGFAPLERHTPSLLNTRLQNWFGWSGEHDSLWSQSIRPIISPAEMAADIRLIREKLAADDDFTKALQPLIEGPATALDDDEWLVTIGKLLAAYQETLVSGRTRFDAFRDALAGGATSSDELSNQEQQGLKIFLNEGRCILCHGSANLSFGEFGDIGVSFFTATGVDKGRYGGIQALQKSPYNRLSRFNDDRQGTSATRTEHVTLLHRNWGEFRVPSLRNVGNTAPYMHNGSLLTLDDVIDFYSELDEERLHFDGEKILRPLNLSNEQKAALKAMLLVF